MLKLRPAASRSIAVVRGADRRIPLGLVLALALVSFSPVAPALSLAEAERIAAVHHGVTPEAGEEALSAPGTTFRFGGEDGMAAQQSPGDARGP